MKRRTALLAVVLLVALAAGFAWFYLAMPVRLIQGYLAETYPEERAPLSVHLAPQFRDLSHVTVRIAARFALDPDYGTSSGAPRNSDYTGSVTFTRQGLRWVPDRGYPIGDRIRGVLLGLWAAADPEVEGVRRAGNPCG